MPAKERVGKSRRNALEGIFVAEITAFPKQCTIASRIHLLLSHSPSSSAIHPNLHQSCRRSHWNFKTVPSPDLNKEIGEGPPAPKFTANSLLRPLGREELWARCSLCLVDLPPHDTTGKPPWVIPGGQFQKLKKTVTVSSKILPDHWDSRHYIDICPWPCLLSHLPYSLMYTGHDATKDILMFFCRQWSPLVPSLCKRSLTATMNIPQQGNYIKLKST